jgi:transposase
MGKPYADDLRLVVVRLIEEGHTRPEVAELCGISLSSVGRYVRRYRSTGRVSPDKFGGYKDYALARYADRIKRWIAKRPDLTLLEIQVRLAKTGVKVAASSVCRFLRHLGLTFKKRMARPVRKRFLQSDLSSLRQRIRPMGIALAKMEIRAPRSS